MAKKQNKTPTEMVVETFGEELKKNYIKNMI